MQGDGVMPNIYRGRKAKKSRHHGKQAAGSRQKFEILWQRRGRIFENCGNVAVSPQVIQMITMYIQLTVCVQFFHFYIRW